MPKDPSHVMIRANIRRLRQLETLATTHSQLPDQDFVADVAHELYKFMMVDEEVLRSAFSRISRLR